MNDQPQRFRVNDFINRINSGTVAYVSNSPKGLIISPEEFKKAGFHLRGNQRKVKELRIGVLK